MKKFFKDMSSKLGIMKDFFHFLMINKKWWLIPIVGILFLFAIVIITAEISPIAPFVYTLF